MLSNLKSDLILNTVMKEKNVYCVRSAKIKIYWPKKIVAKVKTVFLHREYICKNKKVVLGVETSHKN